MSLASLLSQPLAPPLIHLHHPHHPSTALPALLSLPASTAARCIPADLVELGNTKVFYSGVLHRLADKLGRWRVEHEVGTWDAFARGLRELLRDTMRKQAQAQAGASASAEGAQQGWCILVTHAERLRGVLGAQWTVLLRITELTGLPITLVLASQQPWDHLRPHTGDIEPLHIYLPCSSRADLIDSLTPTSNPHPLWQHFLTLFLASFSHLSSDLALVAPPLWALYTQSLPPHAEQHLLGWPADPDAAPLDITVKLLTDLKFALALPLTAATESLLTRQVGRSAFLRALLPDSSASANNSAEHPTVRARSRALPRPAPLELPPVARFLLIAAYCASQNPPRTDLRLFGRGLGTDARRKKGGGTRRAGYGRVKVGKIAQRLQGPKVFTLDRLLAVFAALYAEHAERPADLEPAFEGDWESGGSSEEDSVEALMRGKAERQRVRVERKRKRETDKAERWEEEVEAITMSVGMWGLIPELEAQGLLRRVSPPDRLDNITLRCEIEYDAAVSLAREVRITLDEYLYEAQA